MESDKNEDSQEIHEKISDKSDNPSREAVENTDMSSPKVEGDQDRCKEDNAQYDGSNNFESVKDNAQYDGSDNFESVKDNAQYDSSDNFESVEDNAQYDSSDNFESVEDNAQYDSSDNFESVEDNALNDCSDNFKSVEDSALYDCSDYFGSVEDNAMYDNLDNYFKIMQDMCASLARVEQSDVGHPPSSDHSSNLNLPSTVTVLDTDWGSKVYIVGTLHYSPKSQEDVAKTIRATQPNSVVVELCHDRIHMLLQDERTLFEETINISLQKIKQAVKQFGFLQGLTYILFLRQTAHVTKGLGMAPGKEFRVALKESMLVPNCHFYMGDRGYHITFRRLFHRLSFFQKLKLILHLITSTGHVSRKHVEKYQKMDFLKEMLTVVRRENTDLTRIYVEERDIFLANSLKSAAQPIRKGLVMPTVVGVVGIGHVPGIVEAWKQKTYDIMSINTVPEKNQSTTFWGSCIRLGFIGLASYGCFQLYKLTRK